MNLVPLDDRPCNTLLPTQLAAIAGIEVQMPPRESLGWFTTAGACDEVVSWLQETSGNHYVVALDMLCYGGLVASRTPNTSLEEALRRLNALRALRQSRPDASLFGFSTIARLGTTVARAVDLEKHLLLRSYSQLVDRVERLGDNDVRSKLDEVRRELGPEALDEYLEIRRRNHTVNRAALELVADGVLDYLVLAQEDAADVGIHIPEQFALRGQIEEFRLGERVVITPGADEMGVALLARQSAVAAGAAPGLAIDYASDVGANIVPQFENQPLRQTVEEHIYIAGARVSAPIEGDALLFVHTPIGTQGDAAEAPPQGRSPSLALQAESVMERLEAAILAGRLVGVADLAYCNGGDPEFVAALRRRGLAGRLGAYAGWNTTANTVGTAVCQLCLMAVTGNLETIIEKSAVRRSVAVRLVEDYGYQSCIRAKAAERAREMGVDPFCLGEAAIRLEKFVSSELEPFVHDIYSEVVDSPIGCDVSAKVRLPWERLFEVEVVIPGADGPKNCS